MKGPRGSRYSLCIFRWGTEGDTSFPLTGVNGSLSVGPTAPLVPPYLATSGCVHGGGRDPEEHFISISTILPNCTRPYLASAATLTAKTEVVFLSLCHPPQKLATRRSFTHNHGPFTDHDGNDIKWMIKGNDCHDNS